MASSKSSGSNKTGSFTEPASNRKLQQRLKRIEGQVRGLQSMIEENRYCLDVLTQVSAAQEGLRSVGQEVIRNHLQHCVRSACSESGTKADEIIEELLTVLKKHR